jgi:hypothetical protein
VDEKGQKNSWRGRTIEYITRECKKVKGIRIEIRK